MVRFSSAYRALALASAASAVPLVPRQTNPFTTTPIAEFAEPWSLAFLPDERVLVTEKNGSLRLVDPTTGSKGFISNIPTVLYGGQGGLGDVALHPNFDCNKFIYISYAEPGTGTESGAAIARARLVLDDNGGGALENPEVIWRQSIKDESGGHFSHRILFDADGKLWISSGDRQLFFPAQDMQSNLGKIIRLNDDGSVPEDNPFADQGGIAAQVWALGVRNPLGFDFDAQGRLWEVEMGPAGGDELNLIKQGINYGWPLVSQGNHYNGTDIPNHDTAPEFTPPKIAWTPVISPASMVVYKGSLFPEWTGNVIISGLGALGLVRVEITGETAREAQRYPLGRRSRCVREAPDGSLWTLEDGPGGRLLKITPS
ncbi:Glucose/Sorbosone dehydrogenase [Plectosphaerella cucumerina]|uniref:Glucose/Sorbosone dehydrogenase n=1 Tax=Plectosphaerella cucumerina TaxID=40658 RepID=A0A8K0TIJ4_9PEZI|nr:Glucose/Sorbosone dehydrogenase [Plectosphaerella cucumerina]